MNPNLIQIHDNEIDGPALWGYGGGVFGVDSSNKMIQSASHISDSGHGWNASGTEIESLTFVDAPDGFDEDNSEIVESGALRLEWSGSGLSEQIQSPARSFGLSLGDVVEYGVWVYIDTVSANSLDIYIQVQEQDSAGSYISQAGGAALLTVENQTWTLLKATATSAAALAVYGRIVVQSSNTGEQVDGDVLYVAMAFANIGSDDVPRPSTLPDKKLHFRTKFRSVGANVNDNMLVSSYSVDNGIRWNLASTYNAPFHSLIFENNVGGTQTLVNLGVDLSINKVYELELEHDYASGLLRAWIGVRTEGNLVYSGTHATTLPMTELGKSGFRLLHEHWGTVYEFEMYDHNGIPVTSAPLKFSDVWSDTLTLSGETLDLSRGATDKNSVIYDRDVFEMSGNSGADLNFQIDKSIHTSIDFSGDFFIATSVQSRSDADNKSIIESWTGTQGFRVETSPNGGSDQSVNFITNDGTSSASTVSTVNINDGLYNFIGVEVGTAGDLASLYVNDFETVDVTSAWAGGSLNQGTSLNIGGTFVGGMGATVVFTRVLDTEEREELGEWFEQGAIHNGVPEFVLTDSACYFNPNADSQKGAISSGQLVNLINSPYEQLELRWTLTSTDGVSNPEISQVQLEAGSVGQKQGSISTKSSDKTIGPKGWQHGMVPSINSIENNEGFMVEQYEKDFTLTTLYTKYENITAEVEEDLLLIGAARLYYDGTNFKWDVGAVNELSVAADQIPGHTYSVSLKRTGASLAISINGATVTTSTATEQFTDTATVSVGGTTKPLQAVVLAYAEFDRYIADEEEAGVYRQIVETPDITESITISSNYNYSELNWG
jgi:hypothetical protein